MTQLRFSPFYGLAMPLLKQGQPITPVQLENLADTPGALDGHQILVLSYEFMKPLSAAVHQVLAGWVRAGGGLLYVGDGSDPYHAVREWWNQGARRYPTPAHHLFEVLGADLGAEGVQRVGEGAVRVLPVAPASLTDSADAAAALVAAARGLIETLGLAWRPSNRLALRRGPYLVGAVLDEAAGDDWIVSGRLIDLLDADLPLIRERRVAPGQLAWLRDLEGAGEVGLVASASRVRDWREDAGGVAYVSEAPARTPVRTLLRLPARPARVIVDGVATDAWTHDPGEGLLWLSHPGDPAGTAVEIVAGGA